MLGATRFLTDESGTQIEPAVYTAFGELVSGSSDRFGYVGAHGYLAHSAAGRSASVKRIQERYPSVANGWREVKQCLERSALEF